MKVLFTFAAATISVFILSSCSPGSLPSVGNPLSQGTITAEPEEGGTVSPEIVDVSKGDEIEITATPNENWVFAGWRGDYAGSDNPSIITVNSDKNITAYFIKRVYPLTVNVMGEGIVTEEVVQERTTDYSHVIMVELTALPANDWTFSHWDGDLGGSDNPQRIIIDSGKSVTAVFEKIVETYSVILNIHGPVGRIYINGEDYDPSLEYEYEQGTQIEIYAYPPPEKYIIYLFHQWEGDINSEDNPVLFTLNSDVTLYPVFMPYTNVIVWTRSVGGDQGVGGEVIIHTPPARQGLYEFEQEIEVEAVPDNGWEFVEWNLSFTGSDNPSIQKADVTPGEAVFRRIESLSFGQ
ncbi:MAG: hypothetical protein LAT57_02595 [Balneolales bacterium]|nr:hypothetical protein [Balneolales bacterium]